MDSPQAPARLVARGGVDGSEDPTEFDGRVDQASTAKTRKPPVVGATGGEVLQGLRHSSGFGALALGGRSSRLRVNARVLLPPGVRVDVQHVAVLDEAVHQGRDARGTREDSAPLFE